MAQKQDRLNLVFPYLDVVGAGGKNLETMMAVQKEYLAALHKANRVWGDYLNEEAMLTAEFAKKMTTTRSIPDATAVCQDWLTQQMNLLSKRARQALEETQDFTKPCTEIMGNGGTGGVS